MVEGVRSLVVFKFETSNVVTLVKSSAKTKMHVKLYDCATTFLFAYALFATGNVVI